MTLTKENLLEKVFGIEEVPVRGGSVKVRGLSRSEALKVKGQAMPEEEMEQLLLSTAMVEPKLSKSDVQAWQEASPAGEIEDVIAVIMRLSGMEKAAQKAAYQEFRE